MDYPIQYTPDWPGNDILINIKQTKKRLYGALAHVLTSEL